MRKLKRTKISLLIFLTSLAGLLTAPAVALADKCTSTNNADALNNCIQSTQTVKDIQDIVDVLTYAIAVVIVAAIMIGGIQYAAAGDSPDAVAKAKKRITNALIALVAFLFLDAFIQWLVPGGVFR